MKTTLLGGWLVVLFVPFLETLAAPTAASGIQPAAIEPAAEPDVVVRRIAAVAPPASRRVFPAAFAPSSTADEVIVTDHQPLRSGPGECTAISKHPESEPTLDDSPQQVQATAAIDTAKRLPLPQWQARWQPRMATPEDVTAAIRAPEKVDWSIKPLRDIKVEITPVHDEQEDMPTDYAALDLEERPQAPIDPYVSRATEPFIYYWQASASSSNPLYFEEENLERYGYSFGILQPAVSGIHFFGTIPLLPYKMTLHDPRECVYTLGYSRPGTDTPYFCHRPDLKFGPAVVESTIALEMIFIIP